MTKPILCLDFDGVIHSYSSGWQTADAIPDPPVPGAIEFIQRSRKYFQVYIYSSRSHQEGGREAMIDWLTKNGLPHEAIEAVFVGYKGPMEENRVKFPLEKPAAMITIDDRALTFNGDWSQYNPKELLNFKPWNKR